MTDIVDELRLLQSGAAWQCAKTAATLEDAADEIERLRAERDAARAALIAARENIAGRFGAGATNNLDAPLLARIDAALAAKEPGHAEAPFPYPELRAALREIPEDEIDNAIRAVRGKAKEPGHD